MPDLGLFSIAAAAAGPPAEGVSGSWSWLLFYVGLGLSVSALCSLWEAALLSTTSSHLELASSQGSPAAKIMQQQKANIENPISAILTLNTFAHTIGAANAGAEAAVLFGSQWLGLITTILTLLILIASEIIPKTLGAVYWKQLMGFTAYGVRVIVVLLYPAVWLLQRLTRLLAPNEQGPIITRSELAILAQMGATTGVLAESENRVLKNLLGLESVQVSTIMTPRPVVFMLPRQSTVDAVLQQRTRVLPYSRVPLFGDTVDDVNSFVLRHDLLFAAASDRRHVTLDSLARPIISVPETLSVARVLQTMVAQKEHIALVFDEFGGVAGIVTLEDVLESLLGAEITDESDVVEDMRALAAQRYERQRALLGMVDQLPDVPPPANG